MNEQRQPTPTELLAQQAQELQALRALVQQLMERLDRVRVKVVDVDISFWNLVGLIVKVALAAVPAGLALAVLGWVVLVLVGALVGGL